MQTDLDRFNNQARFVKMIVEKELIVANRKKADIVAELRRLQFRPFPKVSKAKEAGEAEAVVENDVDEDDIAALKGAPSNSDFDYLLGMAIWNLTKEKASWPRCPFTLLIVCYRLINCLNKQRSRRTSCCSTSSFLQLTCGMLILMSS